MTTMKQLIEGMRNFNMRADDAYTSGRIGTGATLQESVENLLELVEFADRESDSRDLDGVMTVVSDMREVLLKLKEQLGQ